MQQYGVALTLWAELPRVDANVAAVVHREYETLTVEDFGSKLVAGCAFVDVKAAFDARSLGQADYRVWRL